MEWSATTAVVAALLGVLLLVVVALGPPLGRDAICAVEKVFGGRCTAPAPPPSNQVVCEVGADTRTASENLQVFFLKGQHDVTVIKKVYSDGHVTYTVVQAGQLQAQAKLFQAAVQAGDVGFDVEASAAAGGQLTGSETFSFPSQAAAAKFEKEVSSAGGWGQVLHDFSGPVGGWILDHVGIHGAPTEQSLAQQFGSDMTSQYVSVGAVAQVTGKASAQAGPVGAQLQAELNGAGGARYITAGPQKGDYQLYLQLGGNASGSLLALAFGGQVNAKGNGTAVVTLGPDGQPLSLQIVATGQAGAGATGKPTVKTGEQGSGGGGEQGGSGGSSSGEGGSGEGGDSGGGDSGSLDLKGALTAGQGVQYTANLNLQNNPAAVQGLVDLLGQNPDQGASEIASQIQSHGTQQLQPFQDVNWTSGVQVQGEVADIGGGVGADVGGDNQQFSAGWIANPGQGWQPVVCKR